jgi:biopolymer transport protein ExbB/TolQ
MDRNSSGSESDSYSLTGLIVDADPVVQAVMLCLVLASIVCWAVIFEKVVQIGRLNREVTKLEQLAKGAPVAGEPRLVRNLLAAAQEELPPTQGETRNETQMRLERAMRSAVRTELRSYEKGLPFLATVGSAAPFVGLFGTVWGTMNSFTSIAQAKDTSLAVVAPGIAEALFATGLGLAAAIPAVVAYNQITVSLGRSAARIGAAAAALAKQFARGQRQAKGGQS